MKHHCEMHIKVSSKTQKSWTISFCVQLVFLQIINNLIFLHPTGYLNCICVLINSDT